MDQLSVSSRAEAAARPPRLVTLGPIEPEQPSSLAEMAYLLIRDLIITLALRPGTAIQERALMAELGLGRTPIREALKRLAHENLVTVVPHRGIFVSDINITDLAAISEVRLPLEGWAARAAAERATGEERRVARELRQEVAALRRGAEGTEVMRLDQRVHRHIYQAAHNRFLAETLDRYLNLSLRVWFLVVERVTRMKAVSEEHSELLAAIEAGRGDVAEEVLRRHVANFEAEIRSIL